MGASADVDRAVVNGAGQAVSALRASIPSADNDQAPPTRATVYHRSAPAAKVLAEAMGCDIEHALETLRRLVEGGYFIAPRVPTDAMLAAYFSAYGQQAWTPKTIIQNIGKARLRWVAMGQAGTAAALSRKYIPGIEAPIGGETRSGSTVGESAVLEEDTPK